MLRSIRVAACAMVLVQAPLSVAFAAEPVVKAPPSNKALDCALAYNKAMRMEDTIRGMMESMLPAMMAQGPSGTTLSETEKRALVSAVGDAMAEVMPQMMDDLAPAMAASFTEAEVCALADFYASPIGQGVIDKMPAFGAASASVTTKYMPIMMERMMDKVCKTVACPGAPKPTKTDAS